MSREKETRSRHAANTVVVTASDLAALTPGAARLVTLALWCSDQGGMSRVHYGYEDVYGGQEHGSPHDLRLVGTRLWYSEGPRSSRKSSRINSIDVPLTAAAYMFVRAR